MHKVTATLHNRKVPQFSLVRQVVKDRLLTFRGRAKTWCSRNMTTLPFRNSGQMLGHTLLATGPHELDRTTLKGNIHLLGRRLGNAQTRALLMVGMLGCVADADCAKIF